MKNRILLISGTQGSGKTTLSGALMADLLRNRRFYGKAVTFAEPLYQMHDFCRGLLKDAGVHPPERVKNKDGDLLQLLGTEWGRKTYGPDLWVNYLRGSMNKYLEMTRYDKPVLFIVSDCRFRNEFDAFPEALRVRLLCPEPERKTRCSMWRENTSHPSEIDLDEYELQGKFDMYMNTNEMTPTNCVDLIMAKLTKDSWIERRK